MSCPAGRGLPAPACSHRRAPRRGGRRRGDRRRARRAGSGLGRFGATLLGADRGAIGLTAKAATGHELTPEVVGFCDEVFREGAAAVRSGRRPLRLRAAGEVPPLLQAGAAATAPDAAGSGTAAAGGRRGRRHPRRPRERRRGLSRRAGRAARRRQPDRGAPPVSLRRPPGGSRRARGDRAGSPPPRPAERRRQARGRAVDQRALDRAQPGAECGRRPPARADRGRQRLLPDRGRCEALRRDRGAQSVWRRDRRYRRAAAGLAGTLLLGELRRRGARRLSDRARLRRRPGGDGSGESRGSDPGARDAVARELWPGRAAPRDRAGDRHVLSEGWRTADVLESGSRRVGTRELGRRIAERARLELQHAA